MKFEFDPSPPPPRIHKVQRILRIMTIVVAVCGLAFFVWRWMNPPQRQAPAPQTPVSAAPKPTTGDGPEYNIDLRTFPLPNRGDNATVTTPPPADNLSAAAAVVGLADVKDGALIERQPLYYLLREVEERYPADDLFIKDVPLTKLSELRLRPQDYRGRPVAVRGRVLRVERKTLPENPSGVREVLDGEIVVPGEGICMFITSRIVQVRPGMTVELRGLFMKLMTYQANDGRMELSPLVVASQPTAPSGTPAATSAPPPSGGGAGWMIGILVVLFVIYIGLQFAMRRKRAGTNSALEARRKARALLGRPMHDDVDFEPPANPPEEPRP